MKDPIILDPPNFDQEEAWQAHQVPDAAWEHRPDYTAACADPGLCSCPNCGQNYWCFGSWQKCADCQFEYPTDAWGMFSWGVQAGHGGYGAKYRVEKYKGHPYFDFGFDNAKQVPHKENLYRLFEDIDWLAVFGQSHFSQRSPLGPEQNLDDRWPRIGSIPRKNKHNQPDRDRGERRGRT